MSNYIECDPIKDNELMERIKRGGRIIARDIGRCECDCHSDNNIEENTMKIEDIYYQYLDLERKLEKCIGDLVKLNNGNCLDEKLKRSLAEEIKYRRNKLDEFKNKRVKILSWQ